MLAGGGNDKTPLEDSGIGQRLPLASNRPALKGGAGLSLIEPRVLSLTVFQRKFPESSAPVLPEDSTVTVHGAIPRCSRLSFPKAPNWSGAVGELHSFGVA